jgi:hypothetical protein
MLPVLAQQMRRAHRIRGRHGDANAESFHETLRISMSGFPESHVSNAGRSVHFIPSIQA